MATSKLSKPALKDYNISEDIPDVDFGQAEYIDIDLSDSYTLRLKEPTAEDFLKLQEFQSNETSEVEETLYTICLLHVPLNGQQKLSMRNAKKLTARQLKRIGGALKTLMGDDEEEDFKS